MSRATHGAPAQALSDALHALARLASWVSWMADTDLPPEPFVSARAMRDAAAALRDAAGLLDEAADRADPPPETARRSAAPVSGPSPHDPSGAGAGRPAAGTRATQEQQPEAEPSPVRSGACRPRRAAFAPPIRSSMETRMNHIAPPHEPAIRDIPLCRLALAPENVRKTPPDEFAEEQLRASIKAHGLLENLVARADEPDADGIERFAVVAGGRRLAALKTLAENGTLHADHPVPCKIAPNGNAGELSLAENVVRIAMHPADQVVAFAALAGAGITVAAIAARFGVSERTVEQRLRLGNAAPDLLDAYRAEKIDLETLMAFAVTTDHDRQLSVWEQVSAQGYRPSAWQVKRMLTEERIPAGTAMARFVGVAAYEATGGPVLRDLFADEHENGVWLEDPKLLNALAMKKLTAAADELATRWKWAEAMPEADWSTTAPYGRIQPQPSEPTDAETAEIERLRTRHDELATLEEHEWTEALAEEAEAIDTRLEAIEVAVDERATFRAEDFAIAGCIATVGRDGSLQVIQGLVRPEDMPKETGSKANGQDADAGTDRATGTARVDGPAVSTPLASPPDPRARAREEAGVGIALADDLRAIRTALIKAHLANDFEAAFDLMVFQLVRAVFARGYTVSWHALDIAFNETADRPTTRTNDDDFAAWSPGEAMLSRLVAPAVRVDGGRRRRGLLRGAPGIAPRGQGDAVRGRGRAHRQGPARLRARRAARARGHRGAPRHRLREARPAHRRDAVVAHQEEPHPRRRPRDPGRRLGIDEVEVQEGRPRQVDGGGVRGRHPADQRRRHGACGRACLDPAWVRSVRHRRREWRRDREGPGTRRQPRRRRGRIRGCQGRSRRQADHDLRRREHRLACRRGATRGRHRGRSPERQR